ACRVPSLIRGPLLALLPASLRPAARESLRRGIVAPPTQGASCCPANYPPARACSHTPHQASACVRPHARRTFSPFVPLLTHSPAQAISPTDQPAQCSQSKLSSTLGESPMPCPSPPWSARPAAAVLAVEPRPPPAFAPSASRSPSPGAFVRVRPPVLSRTCLR